MASMSLCKSKSSVGLQSMKTPRKWVNGEENRVEKNRATKRDLMDSLAPGSFSFLVSVRPCCTEVLSIGLPQRSSLPYNEPPFPWVSLSGFPFLTINDPEQDSTRYHYPHSADREPETQSGADTCWLLTARSGSAPTQVQPDSQNTSSSLSPTDLTAVQAVRSCVTIPWVSEDRKDDTRQT